MHENIIILIHEDTDKENLIKALEEKGITNYQLKLPSELGAILDNTHIMGASAIIESSIELLKEAETALKQDPSSIQPSRGEVKQQRREWRNRSKFRK